MVKVCVVSCMLCLEMTYGAASLFYGGGSAHTAAANSDGLFCSCFCGVAPDQMRCDAKSHNRDHASPYIYHIFVFDLYKKTIGPGLVTARSGRGAFRYAPDSVLMYIFEQAVSGNHKRKALKSNVKL